MITRDAAHRLRHLASLYPVVTITGPWQSGKTTLCRAVFPDLPYVSLEPLDVRDHALRDPRRFLAALPKGAILDEVQRAPDLPSYLQALVDTDASPGRFILTGSQQFALSAAVSQSLAGRTGVLELYPPSWGELQRFPTAPQELYEAIWMGAYPRIFDRSIVTHNTAKAWISVLACHLLGIREPAQLRSHPLRGTALPLPRGHGTRGRPRRRERSRGAARRSQVRCVPWREIALQMPSSTT